MEEQEDQAFDQVASESNTGEMVDDYDVEFQIGDVVDVMSRTWPGMNKPGGVARITKIRYDEGMIAIADFHSYFTACRGVLVYL